MQLDPTAQGPIAGLENWGTGALNVLQCILRYSGVVWDRLDLHCFITFKPILEKPIFTCVNVMDVWMFDFNLNQ